MASAYVNYADILTAALSIANLEGWVIAYDPAKWNKAVQEICTRFSNRVPELQRIRFDTHPLGSHSDEVEQWRHVLAQGGHLEWLDTGAARRIKSQEVLKRVRQAKPEYAPWLQEMAEILECHLALRPS